MCSNWQNVYMLCHDNYPNWQGLGNLQAMNRQFNQVLFCLRMKYHSPVFKRNLKKGSISNNLASSYFKSEGLYVKWFKIAG